MRVQFDDTNANWEKWGALVVSWLPGPTQATRPSNTKELADQMGMGPGGAGITGVNIPGALRPVTIVDYLDDGPLYINLPSPKMLAAKEATIPPAGPYPLPLFYDVAYAGAPRANLSQAETDAFKLRRIGEYTINECC